MPPTQSHGEQRKSQCVGLEQGHTNEILRSQTLAVSEEGNDTHSLGYIFQREKYGSSCHKDTK